MARYYPPAAREEDLEPGEKLCPKCHGKGRVTRESKLIGDNTSLCHTCYGTGKERSGGEPEAELSLAALDALPSTPTPQESLETSLHELIAAYIEEHADDLPPEAWPRIFVSAAKHLAPKDKSKVMKGTNAASFLDKCAKLARSRM